MVGRDKAWGFSTDLLVCQNYKGRREKAGGRRLLNGPIKRRKARGTHTETGTYDRYGSKGIHAGGLKGHRET